MKRAFTGKRDIGLALASVRARSIEVVPRRTEGSEGRGGGDASTLFSPICVAKFHSLVDFDARAPARKGPPQKE